MTMGELFAGIGGFSLGFRRAGFDVVWQVEIEPYCRKVLEKNFPEAERYNDVREVGAGSLQRVDVIAGGFPCQDISLAGKGAGITGARSGLWKEFARIVGELRPRFVVVENVAALLVRGIDTVLGDLAELGYDAEWQIISAADMGAPHLRKRIWIVGYPSVESCQRNPGSILGTETPERGTRIFNGDLPKRLEYASQGSGKGNVADANLPRLEGRNSAELCECAGELASLPSSALADTFVEQWNGRVQWSCRWTREPEEALRDAWRGRREEDGVPIVKPELGRVAYGIPYRVDRLRSLGNAVVPQIPEWIARRILEAA